MTEDEHIKYIMTSEVGALLCKGFAYLYREQPQFPIRKLGEWLLSQGRRKLDHHEISHRDSKKQQLTTQLKEIELGHQRQKEQSLNVQTWQQQKERFMEHINNVQYLQDLLEEWLPEFIEKEKGIAACYVGFLGNQRKIATDNDEDQNAHLDLQAPKVITYIGASKSSIPLMLGNILPPEKGISLQVFKVEDVPEGGDQLAQDRKNNKQKYIYIPNVLKEDKIYYFRIPKLGSYAVFSMVVKNFLSDDYFDKNCEEYKKFVSDIEETEKNRNTELASMRAELQEMEKKEDEATKTTEQYVNLKTNYEALINKPVEVTYPVFQSIRKEYLLGCDTLGQDREISQQTLQEIQEMVWLFVKHWQSTQQKHLIHDINLITSNPIGSENTEASDHAVEEVEAQVSSKTSSIKQRITDEKQISYEIDCARLKAFKRVFMEKGVKSLSVYQQFFVPKFKNALQIVMLVAGYTKDDITLRGTNILDWRKIHHCLSTELVDKILNYNHEGVKSEVPGYARVSKLIERLDKLDMEATLSYNLGLWMLIKIVKMSLALRVAERDLLLEKYELKKKDRQAKQQQSARVAEDRSKALQTHKTTLQPDQVESFNDVEWLATYETDHPLPAIPEEPEFTPYIDI